MNFKRITQFAAHRERHRKADIRRSADGASDNISIPSTGVFSQTVESDRRTGTFSKSLEMRPLSQTRQKEYLETTDTGCRIVKLEALGIQTHPLWEKICSQDPSNIQAKTAH